MKPVHKHDCECCKFLGTLNRVDHYVCKAGSNSAEYIQRYSSNGADYRAIPSQDLPQHPADVQKRWQLTVALEKSA